MPEINPPTMIFGVIALAAILTALGALFSRSTVYSALFLVMNFTSIAFLYFTLGAPFIALAQITVYAGAIMVLFLFVIMLLGSEKGKPGEPLGWTRALGGLATLLVLVEAAYMIFVKYPNTSVIATPTVDTATAQAIGLLLFDKYTLPFEITSFILLTAVIGAIVLTRTDKTKPPVREVK
jgi:NADH-quinone oxidoreductase subunit J